MKKNLRYDIRPELREITLKKVKQSSIFLSFLEERTYEEQKLLLAEIHNILENGVPLEEYLLLGLANLGVDETDYRGLAMLCFFETTINSIEKNKESREDLYNTAGFKEAYNVALSEIGNYINGSRPDFPRDAIRCMLILTDNDLDPMRQRLAIVDLISDSHELCSSNKQREDIEKLINECAI